MLDDENKVEETVQEEPAKEEVPVEQAASAEQPAETETPKEEPVPEKKEEAKDSSTPNNEKKDGKPNEAANSNGKPNGDHHDGHDKKTFGKKRFVKPLEPKEYEERVVYINRISKTVQGGRRMRFSALIVVGNGKGKYGFANCKASEVPDAIKKSSEKAKKHPYSFEIVKGGTIAHEVMGKFGATGVYLKPAPEGTGIIAGGPVRAILELAGVKNVVSKVYGARSAINIINATHEGLSQLKSYRKVWELRGKQIHEETPEEVAAEAVSEKSSKKEGK